ncbi:MAG: metal ABC transporter permease [Actinomycetaceae bacterium]|nr:metal ABC transporter permease [Actinomycetaceae bacterium]
MFEMINIFDFFGNYIYRTMTIGTFMIGLVSGSLGSIIYVRKQSLMSDVVGHSAIFGVMAGFIIASTMFGIDGRSMIVLVIGSLVAGGLAMVLANFISHHSPVRIDAAMAIVLAFFFGGGMSLFSYILNSTIPNRGGLSEYLFGNASTMTWLDIQTIYGFGIIIVIVMVALWKEIKLFSFDVAYCESQGFPMKVLNPLVSAIVVLAIVVGLKAAGLVLMVAFAIIPPAAARQWTNRLSTMMVVSGVIGAFGSVLGSYLSVSIGNIPTGPMIVITLSGIFFFSLLFAPGRSVVMRQVVRRRKRKAILDEITHHVNASQGGHI